MNGNIYAAGNFYNNNLFPYVAKWNGSNWTELGGLSALSPNSIIRCTASDNAGNIYAAGQFTNGTNSGNGHQYVAKFDGINWTELGGFDALAANGIILDLCVDKFGKVYVAGNFTNPNGNHYVAIYNGNSWSELGGTNGLAANGFIRTIDVDEVGNVYAAGSFTNSSLKRYIAKWDGNSWSELGGANAMVSINNDIYSVNCDLFGNVYAVGFFNVGVGYTVAHWNGSSWSLLGNPALSLLNVINHVFTDNLGNVYAAGNFTNTNNHYYVTYLGNNLTAVEPLVNSTPGIYPNPASHYLTLRLHPNEHFEICDMLGHVLFADESKQEARTMDVSNFAQGMYFVRTEKSVMKWMKE
jgi:hypothetical protein